MIRVVLAVPADQLTHPRPALAIAAMTRLPTAVPEALAELERRAAQPVRAVQEAMPPHQRILLWPRDPPLRPPMHPAGLAAVLIRPALADQGARAVREGRRRRRARQQPE